MGHKLSQPEKPGCHNYDGLFHKETVCTEPSPPPPPPPGPAVVNNIYPQAPTPKGSGEGGIAETIVRVTVGSSDHEVMDGSMPTIALFNEFGARIGQTVPSPDRAIPGSFKDIRIQHKKEYGNGRPSYILLHGGDEKICITSIGIRFPDTERQFLTGDDLAFCHERLELSDSRTFAGPNQAQPKCFWIYGQKTQADGNRRFGFHLPDFIWSPARVKAYLAEKWLVCRQSPRFYTSHWRCGSPTPLFIFNPPIDYDSKTHFDKYPERVLTWSLHGKTGEELDRHLSDRPWKPLKSWSKRSIDNSTISMNEKDSTEIIDIEPLVESAIPFTETNVEETRIRTETPRLVISENDLSAQRQCSEGEWDNTDFVSLSEKIYCDMQSRSMLHVCDEVVKDNCWNPDTQRLQGFESFEQFRPLNTTVARFRWNGTITGSALHGPSFDRSWTATGPLFGYAYQNISMIN